MDPFISLDSSLVRAALKSESSHINERAQRAVDFVETLPRKLQNKIVFNLRALLEFGSEIPWLPSDAGPSAQREARERLQEMLQQVTRFERREKAAGAKLSEVFASVDPPRPSATWKMEYGFLIDAVICFFILTAIVMAIGRLTDLLPLHDTQGMVQQAADLFQKGLQAVYDTGTARTENGVDYNFSMIPHGIKGVAFFKQTVKVGEQRIADLCNITEIGRTEEIASSSFIENASTVAFRIASAGQGTFFRCSCDVAALTQAQWDTVVTREVLNSVPGVFGGGKSLSALLKAGKQWPEFLNILTSRTGAFALIACALVAHARDKYVSVWKARVPSFLILTGVSCAAGVILYDFRMTAPVAEAVKLGTDVFNRVKGNAVKAYIAEGVSAIVGGGMGLALPYFPSNKAALIALAASSLLGTAWNLFAAESIVETGTLKMALPFLVQAVAFGSTTGSAFIHNNAVLPVWEALKLKASDARGNKLTAVASNSTSFVGALTRKKQETRTVSQETRQKRERDLAERFRDRGAAASASSALKALGGNVEDAARLLDKRRSGF